MRLVMVSLLGNSMKKITCSFLIIFGLFNTDNSYANNGVEQAICAAVMYYAIGESVEADKSVYRTLMQFYSKKGIENLGEEHFMQAYGKAKTIVEGYSNAEFQSTIRFCMSRV